MATEVLRERDSNIPTEQATQNEGAKTTDKPAMQPDQASTDPPRSHLTEMRQDEEKQADKQTYVSPSDAIMSPASKKLSSFKQKLMDKKGAPKQRSLFQQSIKSREKDFGPA